MPRVVSLIASATEIVCALGHEGALVGRSHECDFPESVQRLPVCTGPKIDVQGTSAEIDRRVKDAVAGGQSVYRVDADLLKRLRPDVIVTQSHCEVCAVSDKDVQLAIADWTGTRPRIVSLLPNCLADVWADVRRVADALGARADGERLITALQQRLTDVATCAGDVPDRTTVACVEWIDPLMAAGNWVPELAEIAGGTCLFGEAGKHSPAMTWTEFCAKDPEVIAVMPCGWDIAKSRQEMAALTSRPEWPTLRAVQNGRVYLTDGNQFFNRPGPRLIESLEILAEVLYSELFQFGYEGVGWERL
jgi:iron complex transport system substrate-binding protein